jgi:hypothetical protein
LYAWRSDFITVHSQSKTTAGVWILTEPVIQVAKTSVEIGRAGRACLDASIRDVPHPATFKNLFDPVLVIAGVTTFRSFLKSAHSVIFEREDGQIEKGRTWAGRTIAPSAIESRALDIAIRPGTTPNATQSTAINDAIGYAKQLGVSVRVMEHP